MTLRLFLGFVSSESKTSGLDCPGTAVHPRRSIIAGERQIPSAAESVRSGFIFYEETLSDVIKVILELSREA